MLRPKTVMLYLIDGIPQGRIKASLSNWTGVCYLLPRTDLIKSKDRSDLRQSGVYLLFGADDDGNQRVYIGQARKRKNNKGVLGRIMEHRDEEKPIIGLRPLQSSLLITHWGLRKSAT